MKGDATNLKLNTYAITFDPNHPTIKEDLKKYAEISFYDPTMLNDFLFVETIKPLEFFQGLDGIIEAREQWIMGFAKTESRSEK